MLEFRVSNGKIKLKVPPAHQSPSQTSTFIPPLPHHSRRRRHSCSKFPPKNTQLKRRQAPQDPLPDRPHLLPLAQKHPVQPIPTPPAMAQGRKSTTNNPAGQSPAVAEAAIAEITWAPALRSVTLAVTPTHRRLALDARDGYILYSCLTSS